MSSIQSLEVRDGRRGHRNGGCVGCGGTVAVVGGDSAGGREIHAERLLAHDTDVLASEKILDFTQYRNDV